MATTEETILSHSQRGMHKIVPHDLDALKAADEILVTSLSNLCLRVCEIDGEPAGGGDPEAVELLRSNLMKEVKAATE